MGQSSPHPRIGRSQKEARAEALCHRADQGLSGGIQTKRRTATEREKTEYGTLRHLILQSQMLIS